MAQTEGERISQAAAALDALGPAQGLTARISSLEHTLTGQSREELTATLAAEGITDDILNGALTIKQLAGQINVIIHAVGILISLPYVLDSGESIEELSLGAGNTGRPHDLQTDRRIAEFKFIDWRRSRVNPSEQHLRRHLQSGER